MEFLLAILLAITVIIILFIGLLALNSILTIGRIRLLLIMMLFAFGFTLYFIGFTQTTPNLATFTAALFQSVQMFVINNNTETMVNPVITNSPFLLSLIRIISIVLFYIVGQFIISTLFTEYIHYISVKLNRKHEVIFFFGYHEKYMNFTYEMSSANRRCIFIEHQALEKKQLPKLANWIQEKRLPLSFLKNPRKIRAFFLFEDETTNLSLAKRFIQSMPKKALIEIHVSLSHEYLRHSLESEYREGVQINFIDEAYLIARTALRKKPIVDYIEVNIESATFKQPFVCFISGLQHLGMAFFKEFIINGQSPSFKPILYLAAKDSSYFQGQLLASNPSLCEVANLDFIEDDIGSVGYFNRIQSILPKCQYLVFAHPDEERNVELVTATLRLKNKMKISKNPVIFCYVASSSRTNFYESLPEFSEVTFFGKNSDVFKKEFLIYDQLDFEAKRYHEVYERQKEQSRLAKGKPYYPNPWSKLHIFTIYSNRVLIDSIPIKLKLLGIASQEECSQAFPNVEAFKQFIGDRLETLTRLEHLRWNALHIVNGFSRMSLEEVRAREPIFAKMSEVEARRLGSPTKDLVYRKHVCLVEFEELTRLEKELHEPYILYDENNITHIPEIIRIIDSKRSEYQG